MIDITLSISPDYRQNPKFVKGKTEGILAFYRKLTHPRKHPHRHSLRGKLPTAGDFDGDGRADIAMLNGIGEWWLGISSGSSFDYPNGSGRWQSATGKW